MVAAERVDGAVDSPVATGWRSLLGNRLLLSLLAVSLVPMALMGLLSQQASSTALKEQAFKQLETVNTITGQGVERYFATLHDELRVLSEDRMIVAAIREFTVGLTSVLADPVVDDKALARARRSLEGYYAGEFATAFRKAAGTEPECRSSRYRRYQVP